MSQTPKTGCSEYQRLSRRQFLRGTTATTAGAVLGLSWLPKVAFAAGGANRDVLISVYLRGGVDGLTLCVPYGDPHYYSSRPNIAIPRPDSTSDFRAIDLDGFFGMPQSMAPLRTPYQNGHLLFVHAVGAPNWSRSHFDAQYWMETARGTNLVPTTGWLGRHLASVAPLSTTAPLRGLSLTHGLVRTMVGGVRTLPIQDPDEYDFDGSFGTTLQPELNRYVVSAYNQTTDVTKEAMAVARTTIGMLDRINFENYQASGGAVYQDNDLAYGFKCAAALIKANVGVEAIHIDTDGFDTHATQGSQNGTLAYLLDRLARAMGAFYTDLSAANRMNWTMVALSEFGRNIAENTSRGTDHGTANAMMVMGGATIGGRVLRSWPGLAPENRLDGIDLRPTIDYRDILGEVLNRRAGNTNLAAVFPEYTPRFRNVVRV